jgi:hypothetical protein
MPITRISLTPFCRAVTHAARSACRFRVKYVLYAGKRPHTACAAYNIDRGNDRRQVFFWRPTGFTRDLVPVLPPGDCFQRNGGKGKLTT